MTTNTLARKFGQNLLKTGENLIKKSFELKPTEITGITARTFIESYYPNAKVILMDGKYKLIGWDKWQDIIESDPTDLFKYIKDERDCDDFSYMFKYQIIRTLGIPCIVVHGHCYDEQGKWLFGHFWNCFIADGKLYFVESISDNWVEVEKGKPVWMPVGKTDKKREYRPISFEF